MDTKTLIDEYSECAKRHGEATLTGDSKTANSAYDKMIESIKEICASEPNGNSFLKLLDHENESVRLWSATHSLFINEDTALPAIKEVAEGEGILSFSASIVVEQWKKGDLKSPFE